jgi:hypothetical protein
MQKLGMSLTPQIGSEPNLPSSIDQHQAQYATERTRLMFGCYRKGDANDPDTYTAAIAAVLAEYPAEVIKAVTDPRTGLPRKVSWLPTVKEVSDACDAEKKHQSNMALLESRGWKFIDGKWQQPGEAA